MLFAFTSSKAQTVDDVVAKHIEAIGGKDAWEKVNSMKLEGSLNIQGSDVSVSIIQLHGRGMRQDISVQGRTGFVIITPTSGWTFLPFQGQTESTQMSPEDLKQSQSELDARGSLLDYKEKGHTVVLAGKEDVGGTECYKLLITLNSGKKVTVCIDSKSYYAVRTITIQKAGGQEQEIETNYSGFEKTPEGIVVAKIITLPYGTLTISNLQVNATVSEEMFKPTYKAEQGS
jgi:outer membrane lipoprotein-sorting protein